MNPGWKAFLRTCLLWLIPGIVTGWLMAVFLTVHEHHMTADLAGSFLQNDSLQAGLKGISKEERDAGTAFLEKYGYRPLGKLGDYIFYTSMISILLFEGIGGVLFVCRRKNDRKLEDRIQELTEYMRSVHYGEAKTLSRIEDGFSQLEDEIYKTVMELKCTKETAVRDHQVLSERIADIAHQLKTPLTSMSLMTELLEDYQTEETKEYLVHLKNQAERLQKLVSGLLILAKLDSHVIDFEQNQVEVSDLINAASEPLLEMINRKEISLEVRCQEAEGAPCWILADMQWTSEALLNILKNCVEHTPKKGTIEVSYKKNPLYAELQIVDSGLGFSKKDLPHLFERFYRGEDAAKDSAGIGLALARLIIEKQNGHIHAENTSDGHARFRLRFYV